MSITHQFPPPQLDRGHRPGERMVAGAPYVFSQTLLDAYMADCRIAGAPSDLTTVTWDELDGLFYAWLNRNARYPRDAFTAQFGKRVCDERATRPQYAAFRKGCC